MHSPSPNDEIPTRVSKDELPFWKSAGESARINAVPGSPVPQPRKFSPLLLELHTFADRTGHNKCTADVFLRTHFLLDLGDLTSLCHTTLTSHLGAMTNVYRAKKGGSVMTYYSYFALYLSHWSIAANKITWNGLNKILFSRCHCSMNCGPVTMLEYSLPLQNPVFGAEAHSMPHFMVPFHPFSTESHNSGLTMDVRITLSRLLKSSPVPHAKFRSLSSAQTDTIVYKNKQVMRSTINDRAQDLNRRLLSLQY